MNYYNYYYFESLFNDEFCDNIIDIGLKEIEFRKSKNESTTAETLGKHLTKKESDSRQPLNDKTFEDLDVSLNNETGDSDTYIRDSEIAWLKNQFIYDMVFPKVNEASEKAGWHYEVDWAEACQFTKYGLNQFYGWHLDGQGDHINSYSKDKDRNKKIWGLDNTQLTVDDEWENKVRKLSVTINLSHDKSYEGGNLKFDLGPHQAKNKRYIECTEIRPRGSMIVFPSFNYHQVTPVTKGTRYSLVMWFLGKPFR